MSNANTAYAVSEATRLAMFDETITESAAEFLFNYTEMTMDEMIQALFNYSSLLSSITASNVTGVFMTNTEIQDMMDDVMAEQVDKFLDSL